MKMWPIEDFEKLCKLMFKNNFKGAACKNVKILITQTACYKYYLSVELWITCKYYYTTGIWIHFVFVFC